MRLGLIAFLIIFAINFASYFSDYAYFISNSNSNSTRVLFNEINIESMLLLHNTTNIRFLNETNPNYNTYKSYNMFVGIYNIFVFLLSGVLFILSIIVLIRMKNNSNIQTGTNTKIEMIPQNPNFASDHGTPVIIHKF